MLTFTPDRLVCRQVEYAGALIRTHAPVELALAQHAGGSSSSTWALAYPKSRVPNDSVAIAPRSPRSKLLHHSIVAVCLVAPVCIWQSVAGRDCSPCST